MLALSRAVARWPAPVRHLALLLLGVLLTWLGTDVVPILNNQSNVIGAALAALLTAVLAVVTPLVTSYGVGKRVVQQEVDQPRHRAEDEPQPDPDPVRPVPPAPGEDPGQPADRDEDGGEL